MMEAVINSICSDYVDFKEDHREWNYEGFNKELEEYVLESGTDLLNPDYIINLQDNSQSGLVESIYEVAKEQYEKKCEFIKNEVGIDFARFERDCMLYNVDSKWMDHIDAMDELKQGIGLVAYAQRDPVTQYKIEGFDMFDKMVESIQYDTVRTLVKCKFEKATQTQSKEQGSIVTNEEKNAVKTVIKDKKPKPNDKCPCGSGKKYKQCCGR